MATFETPITNPELAHAVRGLDAQSLRIARDPHQHQSLKDFIQAQVEPASLEFADREDRHVYDYARISALGIAGTMVHVRMHRYNSDVPVPPELRTMAVIGELGSDETTPWTTLSHETIRDGQLVETQLLLGATESEQTLELVDNDATNQSRYQQAIEDLLADEEDLATTPQVSFGKNGWWYRRAGGLIEPLRDILDVQRRVDLAISRGLGWAAVAETRPVEAEIPEQISA